MARGVAVFVHEVAIFRRPTRGRGSSRAGPLRAAYFGRSQSRLQFRPARNAAGGDPRSSADPIQRTRPARDPSAEKLGCAGKPGCLLAWSGGPFRRPDADRANRNSRRPQSPTATYPAVRASTANHWSRPGTDPAFPSVGAKHANRHPRFSTAAVVPELQIRHYNRCPGAHRFPNLRFFRSQT